LAVAHIQAEEAVELRYQGSAGAQAMYTAEVVQDIHRELFDRIPPSDLFTPENEPIVPGQLRTREVRVGQHVAPSFVSAPLFLARRASFYGNVRHGEAALVALAAAHQRLSWIHPFIDGNGRVMRLQTHTRLHALGYTGGLWSPLPGFARSTDRDDALLADADALRRSDLDGCGKLSEQALMAWIDYVLGALVKRGLLKTDSPQGKVRFGLPQHALRFLFPRLWPEAEADAASLSFAD
jgi:hypothetical protein